MEILSLILPLKKRRLFSSLAPTQLLCAQISGCHWEPQKCNDTWKKNAKLNRPVASHETLYFSDWTWINWFCLVFTLWFPKNIQELEPPGRTPHADLQRRFFFPPQSVTLQHICILWWKQDTDRGEEATQEKRAFCRQGAGEGEPGAAELSGSPWEAPEGELPFPLLSRWTESLTAFILAESRAGRHQTSND